jgi:DnaJ like chaperone protein
MAPLRWLTTLIGMFLGYGAAGPVGGLAGLALGWWLGRPRGTGTGTERVADSRLADAFRTLELKPDASESSVRAAYRRLVHRLHPDKLMARGASEVELREAQERLHRVRQAYDLIRKRRRPT